MLIKQIFKNLPIDEAQECQEDLLEHYTNTVNEEYASFKIGEGNIVSDEYRDIVIFDDEFTWMCVKQLQNGE